MKDQKTIWKEYCNKTLKDVTPLLTERGYTLDEAQPHIAGERFLMSAVTTTGGKKLILLAKHDHKGRVVIKVADDKLGIKEIEHERMCKHLLKEINFAYDVFHTPDEVDFVQSGAYVISIQSFIDQETPFLDRPLLDQFNLILPAFKAQESAHATTYRHIKKIKKAFQIRNAVDYVHTYTAFLENIRNTLPDATAIHATLEAGGKILRENQERIEQYCGFLTHTDFVPHNFRISNNIMYLLDHSSLCFGNKHEGWARFLNFMTLYNPALEAALIQYIKENKAREEFESLRLMRIYRLGEIIWYYTNTLSKSDGDLYTLNEARVEFWSHVLTAVVANTDLSQQTRDAYIMTRDSLRSEDEKSRQRNLH